MTTAEATVPESERMEQDLIGACLLHHQAFGEASRYVEAADLYRGTHRALWRAMAHQVDRGGAPDWVSLPEALRAVGVTNEGDVAELWRLAGGWRADCDDHTKARWWAEQLEVLAVRRRVIQAAGRIADAAYDLTDGDALAAKAYQTLGDATERRHRTGETTLADTSSALYDRLTEGETGQGLLTGLPRLDGAMKGLRPGELTVLAARTAHGKTALALQIARQVAGAGASVAVLSLEMDADSLTERLASAASGVSVRTVLDGAAAGDDDLAKVIASLGPLAELPITFAVAPATTLPAVKQLVSRWADAGLANLLIVDYLQLIGLGRAAGNRAYEVGQVAQELRDLAQRLRIPVLALAQLSRAVEHRADARPVLADLRESGGIEQAADNVLLLWRPELLGTKTDDAGVAYCHLAKNRSGPLATEPLLFDAPTTAFKLLTEWHVSEGN